MIHPTAIVEPGAQLGVDCEIHPYAIVKACAVLGDRVIVHPFAVVGGDSQDLKFKRGTKAGVRIGSGTCIRESVTINCSSADGTFTEVGENCLLMACSHVAHDCVVGHHAVIANAVLLAGHVTIGNHVVLGGGSLYHQFIRVGDGVMVGGGAVLTLDLPPYTLAAGRNTVFGLNVIGLRRRGATREAIAELKDAFRAVHWTPGSYPKHARAELDSGRYRTAETRYFLEFFLNSKRGFCKARREAEQEDDAG